MNTPINVPLDVAVYCSDGLGGRSSQVIVDPTNKQVTHVVVKEQHAPHTEYMVPVDQLVDSTPDMIKLRGTIAGLAMMEPFIHIDTLYTDAAGMGYSNEEPGYIGSLGMGYAPWPQHDPGERFTVNIKTDATPVGEIALTHGAHIHASDGHQVGQLDGFLTEATTGQISHLVLREGHFWGKKEVTIPVAQIDHMQEERVYLKLDKESIGALPTTPART